MSGNKVPGDRTITQMAWAVHDLKTAAAAKSFISEDEQEVVPEERVPR